eukprot:542436-Rhodomonas_salina.1
MSAHVLPSAHVGWHVHVCVCVWRRLAVPVRQVALMAGIHLRGDQLGPDDQVTCARSLSLSSHVTLPDTTHTHTQTHTEQRRAEAAGHARTAEQAHSRTLPDQRAHTLHTGAHRPLVIRTHQHAHSSAPPSPPLFAPASSSAPSKRAPGWGERGRGLRGEGAGRRGTRSTQRRRRRRGWEEEWEWEWEE